MNTVLIYISKFSPRANYTFEVLLKNILGLNFETTTSIIDFNKHEGAKFSYCKNTIMNELHFVATNLLFEKNIDNTFYQNKNIDEAFAINNKTHFSFDIFAASFYLLSRYEEYNQPNFNYTQSILHRSNLLQHPIVNEWAIELKRMLTLQYPALQFKNNEYKVIATFDIDRAFAFKARGLVKSIGGLIRDLLKLNFLESIIRIKVLQKKINDPFDVYDYIETVNKSVGLQSIYFLHCGNYSGADKNVNFSHSAFKNVVQKISSANIVGIHPSIKSINNTQLLSAEIATLQANVNSQKITASRQHYIQCKFPESYLALIENNLKEDYTMGYANQAGFRAGISNSYNWYNVSSETATHLVIHPFCIMEATYQYYKNNNMDAFLEDAKTISGLVKSVGGNFCFVWHNQSLSEIYEYKGWSKVYYHFLTAIL